MMQKFLGLGFVFVSMLSAPASAEDFPEKAKCEQAIQFIRDNNEVCKRENLALKSPMANCTDKVKARSVFSAERTCRDALAKAGKAPAAPPADGADKPKGNPDDKPARRRRNRDPK